MTGARTYRPEIGQMLFGQPPQQYEVSDLMEAALEKIGDELSRVVGNLTGRRLDPFSNEGSSFRCKTFTVCSYSWDDELAQPYNFKHPASGLTVSWYKYLGRGMSASMVVSPELASRILTHCLMGLEAVENGRHTWDEPGLYPDGAINTEKADQ